MSDKKDYKFSDYSIAELKKICNDFKSQHTLRNIGELSKSELVSAMEKIFYFTEGKLYLRNSHERKLPLPEKQRNQAKIKKLAETLKSMYKSVDTINEKLTNIDSDINEYSIKLEQDKKEKKHLQSSLRESVTIIKSLEDEINELDKIL